jgi:hypothetical protein
MLPVSLDCPFLIAPSVFSKVYSLVKSKLTAAMNYLDFNTNFYFEVVHVMRNAFHDKIHEHLSLYSDKYQCSWETT